MLPILREAHQGDWKQDLARSALHFERTGAFPRNTEIEAALSTFRDNPSPAVADVLPDGRTMSLRIHHSFVELPEPGSRRGRSIRGSDSFLVSTATRRRPSSEPIERYLATRWRLGRSPASRPQPIVYYLDRGIPEPERTAIRDAVLWWNHAFAEAGFPNALRVEDLPVGATFLDVRYSGDRVGQPRRAGMVGRRSPGRSAHGRDPARRRADRFAPAAHDLANLAELQPPARRPAAPATLRTIPGSRAEIGTRESRKSRSCSSGSPTSPRTRSAIRSA